MSEKKPGPDSGRPESAREEDIHLGGPIDEPTPVISEPAHVAGGANAVFSSIKHLLSPLQGISAPFRGMRAAARLNQKDGFDCPGCAWPDPDDRRSRVEYCENGAKAIGEETTARRAGRELFASRSLAELSAESDFTIGQFGRLVEPMLKREGGSHYEPIGWDEAFALIAEELAALTSPNEAVFYTSGRTSNEAAFLYQLFVRMFGTNNLPDCSNMCHESSGVALGEVIGIGKGTVTLEDFDHADCIVVIGQNPGTNHPRMLTALQRAARNRCQIISINPLLEAGVTRFKHPQEIGGWIGRGTPLACLHLPVRIGGDVALLKGIMKEILFGAGFEGTPGGEDSAGAAHSRSSALDLGFIRTSTRGFEAFAEDLRQEGWDKIMEESGISRVEIAKAAAVIGKAKRLICCWAMGLTQHANAVGNIQSIVNLLLLGGHFGRPGAGACPVRGHSNVQGDRTMGIWEKPTAAFLDALSREFGFAPPRDRGLDTVESIHAMAEGRVGFFFGMGGNFLSATPDTEIVARALGRCRLTVHVSTKLNRAHLVTGRRALILPCLGRTEEDRQVSGPQFVTVENSMGVVHSSRGRLKPASPGLKSEVAIVAGLAKAVLSTRSDRPVLDWDLFAGDYREIRQRISRVIPGFEDFEAKVEKPGGFYLPNSVRDSRSFSTPDRLAHFTVHPIPRAGLQPGRYRLMTIRSHDQFNTTLYGLNDRYRGVTSGRRVIFMNRDDARERGFTKETRVDITSHFRGEERRAPRFLVVPYDIPRGCLATYFPEANCLVPLGQVAEKSNTPAYKSIEVSLIPEAQA